MPYPDNCIKGVPNNICLHEYQGLLVASSSLFCFSNNNYRDDGWIEESVNWNDDGNAITHTLNQKKQDEELQFKFGIAIIPRKELDRVKKKYSGLIDYERSPIKADPDKSISANPYHGNILLRNEIPSTLQKQLRALLADIAEVKKRESISD